MKAILLSGGLDSSAVAWMEKPEHCIFIDYGQLPVNGERKAAKLIAESINANFFEVSIDCNSIGRGFLSGRKSSQHHYSKEWWPYRNQLLVTLAASTALENGVKEILLGTVKTDTFHTDGTNEFIEKLSSLMEYQEGNLSVRAPAIKLRCEDLLKQSGLPLKLILQTHSCHVNDLACGICPGCHKHYAVFDILGVKY